jgi:hypothetical protein
MYTETHIERYKQKTGEFKNRGRDALRSRR